jgi:hypothetical protein
MKEEEQLNLFGIEETRVEAVPSSDDFGRRPPPPSISGR